MARVLNSLDEVLERLTKVFREEGYESASLSRLSAATGLGRASLYHHFPGGKVDMANAVAERSNEIFHEKIVAPIQLPGDPQARIDSMMASLDRYFAQGQASCLLGMLAMGGSASLFQQHVRNGIERWVNALAAVLQDAGMSPADAHERAEAAVLRIEGALLVARGTGDPGPFRRTLKHLQRTLLAA